MIKKRLLFLLVLILVAPLVFGEAVHRVYRLGNPRTSFCRPMAKKANEVPDMVHKKKAQIQAILEQRGWTGNIDDLVAAVDAGKITETTIEKGAQIPWMAVNRHGKPGYIENVIWQGQRPLQAFVVEFDSNNQHYRMYIPKPCGNFWLESSAMAQAPAAAKPVVTVQGADVCVTQAPTLRITVENATPGSNVQITMDGQNVATAPAENGTMEKQLAASNTPGSHAISVTLDGAEVPATATVTVKECPPVCALAALPPTVRRRTPLTIDASGSQVAAGVTAGIKTVSVQVLKDEKPLESFDMTAPNLTHTVAYRKGGVYTFRATVTDEVGQKSTNVCEAKVEVPPYNPLFFGGFVGKERMIRDEFPAGRCAPNVGFKVGVLPEINDKAEFELSGGVKVNTRDTDNTGVFVDAAINGIIGRGFVGGGVSFWDLNLSDTRAAALLIQFGFDLDPNGRFQLTFEGRGPFKEFDNLKNNYQFWGGVRIRPWR